MAKMAARTIRVDDELWAASTAQANEQGVSLSDILRHALIRFTGNYAGAAYSGAAVDIYGGSLVLSNEWNNADPEKSRFHMVGCDIELRGLDLWITPSKDPPSFPTDLKAAAINGNHFQSPPHAARP